MFYRWRGRSLQALKNYVRGVPLISDLLGGVAKREKSCGEMDDLLDAARRVRQCWNHLFWQWRGLLRGAVSKNKGGREICQVWHEVTEEGPEKLSGAQERAPGVVVWFEEVGRASAATEVYGGGGP